MNSLIPTASDSIYLMRFMLFLGLIIIPIGALVLKLFKVKLLSRLEYSLFVFITGTLISNSIYFILRLTHLESFLFHIFITTFFIFMISFVFTPRTRLFLWKRPSSETWILAAILLFIAFYHFHRTWHAIVWMPDGRLVFWQNLFADPVWKLSIASELEHSVPPQMPIFAESRLTYHYFMELFTVFVHFMTRIDLISLRFFIIPLYSFFITGLAIFVAFKDFLKSARLALFSVFMVMLVSGLGNVEDAHIPFAVSIYLAVIILISRTLESKNFLACLLAIIMIAHTMLYEAIVSATFLAGLSIASLLILVWRKRFEPLLTIILGGILVLIVQRLVVGRIAGGDGQHLIGIQFPFFVGAIKDFLPLKETLRGLIQAYHSQTIISYVTSHYLQLLSLPFLGLIAVLLFSCRIYGISLLALPVIWNKIKNIKNETIPIILILPVLAFGIIFPLIFSFPFLWAASFRMLFNTVAILIGFVPLAAQSLWKKSRLHQAFVCTAILCLFFVPLIKFQFYFKEYSSQYGEITANEMQLFNYLRTQTPPDAVLMHPFIDHDVRDANKNGAIAWVFKDHYYFGSALGGRRVVLEGSKQGVIKESTKLTQPQIDAIMADIATVYVTHDANQALNILKKYHVSFLWVPSAKSLQFQHTQNLKLVISNSEHSLYQVLNN